MVFPNSICIGWQWLLIKSNKVLSPVFRLAIPSISCHPPKNRLIADNRAIKPNLWQWGQPLPALVENGNGNGNGGNQKLKEENITRIANAVPCLSFKGLLWMIVVLNYQKCDQYLKDHKCLGLLLRVFSKCLCQCHCHCLFVGHVMSPHHSDQMSQRSQVSRVALWGCSFCSQ